jgi:hypothetical protein
MTNSKILTTFAFLCLLANVKGQVTCTPGGKCYRVHQGFRLSLVRSSINDVIAIGEGGFIKDFVKTGLNLIKLLDAYLGPLLSQVNGVRGLNKRLELL